MNIPRFHQNSLSQKTLPHEKQAQIAYICAYYRKSCMYYPTDRQLLFGLPYPYLVPDCEFFTELFYWDSYFMMLGLSAFGDVKIFFHGMLLNFAYEIERFGRIPNNNAYYSLSRSQPPYFSLMIQEYLRTYPSDIRAPWIDRCVRLAIAEYEGYWLADDRRNANHLTVTGLSRYWDIHGDLDIFAEYESGWDTTSRFGGKCMSINPVDLNTLLYLYEAFFAWYFGQQDREQEKEKWKRKMAKRKIIIDRYCWDKNSGVYMDYNFEHKKRTGFISAASFFPFYAGFPSAAQAQRSLPELLRVLEQEGGIAITQRVSAQVSRKNQWDYPHGWAPLQYIAYTALQRYGFIEDARRIREKWLAVCDYWFAKDGCFYEKYNVEKIGHPVVSSTPARAGFGWTNGVYMRFLLDAANA